MHTNFRFFSIGPSSSGWVAISEFIGDLSKCINAAFAVVVHTSTDALSIYAQVLKQKIALQVDEASNGMYIVSGRVHICRPNYHLFVEDGKLVLSKGP